MRLRREGPGHVRNARAIRRVRSMRRIVWGSARRRSMRRRHEGRTQPRRREAHTVRPGGRRPRQRRRQRRGHEVRGRHTRVLLGRSYGGHETLPELHRSHGLSRRLHLQTV